MRRQLRKIARTSPGCASVARSKSFGVRSSSRSRTQPPTKYAWWRMWRSRAMTLSASASSRSAAISGGCSGGGSSSGGSSASPGGGRWSRGSSRSSGEWGCLGRFDEVSCMRSPDRGAPRPGEIPAPGTRRSTPPCSAWFSRTTAGVTVGLVLADRLYPAPGGSSNLAFLGRLREEVPLHEDEAERFAHGLEAPAVDGTRAEAAQRFEVLRGGIPLVPREAIARVREVELRHQRVACGLREDRGGGDRERERVPVDDGGLRDAQVSELPRVDEEVVRARGERPHRPCEREEARPVDVQAVDLLHLRARHRPADRVSADVLGEPLALLAVELLRVVDAARPVVGRQHACARHHRPCERRHARLVHPGDVHDPLGPQLGLEAEQVTEALPLSAVLVPTLADEPEHLARSRPRIRLERRLAPLRQRPAAVEEAGAQLVHGEGGEVLGAHHDEILPLAPRAEERRALRLDDPEDLRLPAAGAPLPLAAVDREGVIGPWLLDIRDLGPLLLGDRVADRGEHRFRERLHLAPGQRSRLAPRVEARAEERLRRLDVPDPGQDPLVHDPDLHGQPGAGERLSEACPVDAALERIVAERGHLPHRLEARPRNDAQASEEAVVVEVEDRAVVEVDPRTREAGGGIALGAAEPLPGHAEVGEEAERLPLALERDEQVLADAPDLAEPRACERPRERGGGRRPEHVARLRVNLDPLDPATAGPGSQVSRRDLDFRQLRHASTSAGSVPVNAPESEPGLFFGRGLGLVYGIAATPTAYLAFSNVAMKSPSVPW